MMHILHAIGITLAAIGHEQMMLMADQQIEFATAGLDELDGDVVELIELLEEDSCRNFQRAETYWRVIERL